MKKTFSTDKIVRIVVMVVIIVGVVLFTRRLSAVLIPFAIGIVAAYVLNPAVIWLERRLKFSRGVASVTVVFVVLMAIVGTMLSFIPSLVEEFSIFNNLIKEHHNNQDSRIYQFFNNEVFGKNGFLSNITIDGVLSYFPKLMPKLNQLLSNTLDVVAGVFSFFMVILYTTFLLIDFDAFFEKCKEFIPERYNHGVSRIVDDVTESMQLYFRAQGSIALIVGVLMAIGFKIIGLPLGIGLGICMGVLNMVPYLQLAGVPVALMLAVINALQNGTSIWLEMLWVSLVMIVVQVIQETVLNPRILGRAYSMSPAIVLLSLSIWGSLLGILGMILALPMTALIFSYVKHFVAHRDELLDEI